MKIIIVGSNSMLGKHLGTRLSVKHTIIKAGRDVFSDIYLDLEVINNTREYCEKADAIIHCAASFGDNHVLSAMKNEVVNSVGAFQVARLAEQTQCNHLIYISTISTYNEPANGYFGSYGLSKRHAQENLALMCDQLRIGYTALLPTCLYDQEGEARKHQKFLYYMMDLASQGKNITIYGNVDPKRNYLYIEDFVTVVERVLDKRITGIFPCVHPTSVRLSEIANAALTSFGKGGTVTFLPEMPNQLGMYIPEDYSIYQVTECFPIVDLFEGIESIKKCMYS